MCGKFAAGHLTQAEMLALMEYFLYGKLLPDGSAPTSKPGFNISPTDQVQLAHAIEGATLLTSAKWQMELPKNTHKMINSKIENVDFWKDFWKDGRCVIPALGYYEWSGASGRKEPYFVTVKRNAPMLFFAGFYSIDRSGTKCCTIMTRPAAKEIAHLHPRMPVILSPDEIHDWLGNVTTADQAQETLGTSHAGRFEYHRVKPIDRKSDGPDLIEPYDPPQTSFDF